MYTISEVASILGISVVTLRRWDKKGILPCIRTLGGHRRYPKRFIELYLEGKNINNKKNENYNTENMQFFEENTEDKENNKNINNKREIIESERIKIVYARVSSYKQKKEGNLDRQIERIITNAHLPKETKIISEYGSGLNTDRKGLNRLLRDVEQKKISDIYIEYKDRLTRFGYRFLERYCAYFGTGIHPISNNDIKSPAEALSEDIMALLVCFSGKLYSKRKFGNNYTESISNKKNESQEEAKIIKEKILFFNKQAGSKATIQAAMI